MNKRVILTSVLLVILPLVIGIGLVYVNQELVSYTKRTYEMTWVLIWEGVKSTPIFAYMITIFVAIKSVLAKQNKGLLSVCAFAGALIVILSFVLYMFGIVFGVFGIIMFANYQLLAPLAFCNIILGIYILKKKSIE